MCDRVQRSQEEGAMEGRRCMERKSYNSGGDEEGIFVFYSP